jgi:hypothetical protein
MMPGKKVSGVKKIKVGLPRVDLFMGLLFQNVTPNRGVKQKTFHRGEQDTCKFVSSLHINDKFNMKK